MAGVEFNHVEKVFESGAKVVSDLCLEIRDREFVVLLGPSGCGKSTTLRMVAGLESVSSGTISIAGRVVNDIPPKDRDIAMVFQNYALYPHMTVFENIAFGLRMRHVAVSDIEAKVRHAAQVLGIESRLGRYPRQLSGGERQRVALGRAIVRDPKCFLFDEPLSNLDSKLRVDMRAELKRLHLELKSTTLYVTHDQEEAMTLGDRVVVLSAGVVQQFDTALRLYQCPRNRFVAGFLGSPPMNFLAGTLELQANDLYFNEGSGCIQVPHALKPALLAYVNESVVLGVRPEAMSIESHARFAMGNHALRADVTLVQPLGDRMNVHLATSQHPKLVAQLESTAPVQMGAPLMIHFDPQRIHFFAPGEYGKNLTAEAA
jgi:multiple sugar transport system ATP-binding protein